MADIQARTSIAQQKVELDAYKAQQLDERESARIAGDISIREFQAETKAAQQQTDFDNDVDLEVLKARLKEAYDR